MVTRYIDDDCEWINDVVCCKKCKEPVHIAFFHDEPITFCPKCGKMYCYPYSMEKRRGNRGLRKMENSYNSLKREVASALSLCLFGTPTRKKKAIRPFQKEKLNELMRELDKTFKMHGVDWKLNG